MTPLAWLFTAFGAVFSTLVAVFYKYYKPTGGELDNLYLPPNQPNPPSMPPTPTPTPIVPSEPNPALQHPATASSTKLTIFCTALRDYEGKPGDLNYQLNNPGDCRPSPVGYLPRYQPVEIIDTDTDPRYPYHVGKFAKFPSYEVGWQYLENMVQTMAENHPVWTILDFFTHFAPSGDRNDPNAYAENVAGRCGVSPTTTLQALFG